MVADEPSEEETDDTDEVEDIDEDKVLESEIEPPKQAEESDEDKEDEEEISNDPELLALQEQEKELQLMLKKLEDELRTERKSLTQTKDKLSESGKTGFFIIQAKVSLYLCVYVNVYVL